MESLQHMDAVFAAAEAALQGVRKRLEQNADVFLEALDVLGSCKGKIVLTGIGKSGAVARKIAATFASTGCSSIFLNAADALHGDLGMIDSGDVVVMLSNGAATNELIEMVPRLRAQQIATIGFFGRTDTLLAQKMNVVVDVSVSAEGCPLGLAPMASTTLVMAVGDAFAAALMQRNNFQAADFAQRHPAGSLGKRLLCKAGDVMHKGEQLPVVGIGASFQELLQELSRANLGLVCVVDDGKLLGVVSDGDVRRAMLSSDPFAQTAENLMTEDPVVTDIGVSLNEVLSLMEGQRRKIYAVPVVDKEKKLLGLVRMHDIVSE